MSSPAWQFWIDRGGTFTDVIARSPTGELVVRKLLSDNPRHYADAAVAGIVAILGEAGSDGPVGTIRIGTTVATNALLERQGEPTVFITTEGLGDALIIGYQNRPELFSLQIRRPDPLHDVVVEAAERINASGEVLVPLDTASVQQELAMLHKQGYSSCAICLLHGYDHPGHERAIADIATVLGFEQISCSHEVNPLIRLVSRGDTTVADAYLSPVLRRYTARLRNALEKAGLHPEQLLFMQSNGGLVDSAHFHGKDSVLSGPAGGVVGMAKTCEVEGHVGLIGFDMGGTSTDVSLYHGEYERVSETRIAGVRLRVPMIRIHTVAAGGGSILRFEDGRFQVGPESAGADPGPMSYRQNGPLTVTDANLLLGRLLPECFPAVFGPDGDQVLDRDTVADAFEALAARVCRATGSAWSAEECAEGFIRVAVDSMANAIKTISIQRGEDPSRFALCCFGGAAGQHACRVADALGMERIVLHPLASVLSACGIGLAPLQNYRERALHRRLDESALEPLHRIVRQLEQDCSTELEAQGVSPKDVQHRTILQINVPGTDSTLPVSWTGDIQALRDDFTAAHQRRYGFICADGVLNIESVRVEASGSFGDFAHGSLQPEAGLSCPLPERTAVYSDGSWQDARLVRRAMLGEGDRIPGPAVVVEEHSTVIVEPGWQLQIDTLGRMQLARVKPAPQRLHDAGAPDPVLLEMFNNHFMNVAEQMGAVLENTAHSVNIKERRDFSCALFDASGRLIANAPHIPVHLGSMGTSVREVLKHAPMQSGDAWMLNDPYHGGTHLPDVTVISPVHDSNDRLRFVVACRAHHADIGGCEPGSMPPFSQDIREEGICFDRFLLVRDGRFNETSLRERLGSSPFPARNPDRNLADLRAQLAANEKGRQELLGMLERSGSELVEAYAAYVQDNAEQTIRNSIVRLSGGSGQCQLDDGSIVKVAVTPDPDAGTVEVDFHGTSPQAPGNLNAPEGVTVAAVMYAFRCLANRDIPLNAGCLRPITIHIPRKSLLNPEFPAAVAGGNVETSQCIADALFAAMGVLAGSQGTMNNLSFGNAKHQYYETICGGAGAGPDFDGASAVHTHMTNSRITDPEVLEQRYPVLLREFSIRHGSGGAGRHTGGNGVIRAIEFTEPMRAAIVSNHRIRGPAGLAGGHPGKPGINMLVRSDGQVERLPAIAQLEIAPGDMVVIATPGGGGYGAPGSIDTDDPQ